MDAECISRAFGFHEVGGREVIAQFNGGQISSDGGGQLLGVVGFVLRVPSVIPVDDQFGFWPDQTQEPILVPFIEALQRSQEIIDSL